MKKHIFFLTGLFLLVSVSAYAKTYYLSPSGADNNPGSFEKPYASLAKVVSMLAAGDTCFVRGGEYFPDAMVSVTATGTKDARICLWAYEDEIPVFNFSRLAATPEDVAKANRGVYHKIGANYWHYKGLTFCNAPDNAMKLEGSFCVVERCVFHDNGDTGLQQGFGKDSSGNNTRNPNFHYGRYNIVLNCDSYNNCDVWSNGGDADGFAVKLFPGPGNEFHGCRSWYNSDDGWDFYYTVFPIVVDNCWTMNNGYNKGNGNGFKMGGSNDKKTSYGAHVFTNCISTDNQSKGFDQNNHNEGTYILNCVSVRNGVNYGFNNAIPANGNWVLRNCIGFGGKERNHQFNTKDSPSVPRADIQYCSWTTLDNCSPYNDRDSSDPYTGATGLNKSGATDRSAQFVSLSYEDALAPRQANGELPLTFGRLKETSDFVDAGMIIENLQTVDCHKSEYELCGTKENYGITVSLPYSGTTADMGAFEYGIDENEYILALPENDGSVPDAVPEASEWEENGKFYAEHTVLDWYPFQDAVLPDSLSFMKRSENSAVLVKPDYLGKVDASGVPSSKYTGSMGAYYLPKTAYVDITLPSLRRLEAKIYCTGGRDLKVTYTFADGTTETKTTTYKEGTYTVDLSRKTKHAITVRLENVKTSGDMYITDLYISNYIQVDEEGRPTAIDAVQPEVSYDMYQTETSLIVYGEVASLHVMDMGGRTVAGSRNMQVVNTASLPKGVYAVRIEGKDGRTAVQRFVKR